MPDTKRDEATNNTYEELRDRVKAMNKADSSPTDRERADWAYGNTKMENDAVTREMAEEAVQRRKTP
jgi:hypothetical protein